MPVWTFEKRQRGRRGEFVCEYAGELLSSAEAARRQRRAVPNYIFVVREHSRSGTWRTIIDPTHTGNVGRFANHSCDPNLAVHLVRVASLVPSAGTSVTSRMMKRLAAVTKCSSGTR